MSLTEGAASVRIGLIDGPFDAAHPRLAGSRMRLSGRLPSSAASNELRHGTFSVGTLASDRSGVPPGMCPGCEIVVHPISLRHTARHGNCSAGGVKELVAALLDLVEQHVDVINISAAAVWPTYDDEQLLRIALDRAAQLGVLVVSAAPSKLFGAGSTLTRHPWVLPVAASTADGVLTQHVPRSVQVNGVRAPGERVPGLAPGAGTAEMSGSSVAAIVTTGMIGLLLSLDGPASAQAVLRTLRRSDLPQSLRRGAGPPLVDAWEAHRALSLVPPQATDRSLEGAEQ
ncbi:S8 family serine peptidase [Geodermatophilus sp. SYSU D00815]